MAQKPPKDEVTEKVVEERKVEDSTGTLLSSQRKQAKPVKVTELPNGVRVEDF